MELVILGNLPLDSEQLAQWRRQAALQGVALHIARCGDPEQVSRLLDRAAAREQAAAGPALPFLAEDGGHMIHPAQLRYLRGEGHRITLSLSDGRLLRSRTLRFSIETAAKPYLEHGQFLRAGHVLYVNTAYVDAVTGTALTMTNGEKLHITRSGYRNWRASGGL